MSTFSLIQQHAKMLQENALKVFNPKACTTSETIQLETISLLSSIVDYLQEQMLNPPSIGEVPPAIVPPLTEQPSVQLNSEVVERKIDKQIESNCLLIQPQTTTVCPVPELSMYYSSLQEWTQRKEARVVYSSDNLTPSTFWQLTKGLNNLMIIVKTVDDFIFGSYHSILPDSQDTWVRDDPEHFVFTLNNPHGIKPTHFYPLPSNHDLLFIYNDNDVENVAWVNYCYWICSDNVVYVWHHFPDNYIDTIGLGGDLFVGDVDWDNSSAIKCVYLLEWTNN